MGLYITSVHNDCVIQNDSLLFVELKHDLNTCKIYLKENLTITISMSSLDYTQNEKSIAIRAITEAFTGIRTHILSRKKSTIIELPDRVYISINRENKENN